MAKRIVFLFFLCLLMAVSCERPMVNEEDDLKIEVLNGVDTRLVSGWLQDDTLYFAVPSYASLDSLKVFCSSPGRLEVNNPLTDEEVSFVYPGFVYKVKGKRTFAMVVLKSANLPTVYIDTQSGSEANINEDKSHKEKCDLQVIDGDGVTSYRSNSFECSIKGRGNSTWRMEKKPYQLKLPKKSSFLGMNPAKKWVLLANAVDETNLRNKIVYDFARHLGFGFVPDSRFADVFLNGKYNGLYLISEKVECAENRLNAMDCDSLFLFQQTSIFQSSGRDNCFMTECGQRIALDYPQNCSERTVAHAQLIVRKMENIIMGNQNAELEQYFDIYSWACKYLIDDVFENTDCNFLSSYFYAVYKDGSIKYYAGPIWDYDRSIGNSSFNYEPDLFLARRLWKHTEAYIPYYGKLHDNPVFYDKLCQIYKDGFRPLLDSLVFDGGIRLLAEEIEQASLINQKRWFHNKEVGNTTYVDVVIHLSDRVELLDKLYCERIPVVLVSYERVGGKFYCYRIVPKGEKLDRSMLQGAEQNADVVWVEKGTNQPFDFNRELTEDIVLDILR